MDPYIKHLNELVYTVQILSEELEIAYDIMDSLFEDEDYELKEEVLLEKKKWIQDAIKKEGSLRKTMKTKEGKNIPVSKLEKAAEKGGKTGKRARLALTLRKLSKKKLNEDKAALERAAMNPSGAYTPKASTMAERKKASDDAVTLQMRQGREAESKSDKSMGYLPPASTMALGSAINPAGWAAAMPPGLAAAGGFIAGMEISKRTGLQDAESNLELEKIKNTAPGQKEEYAKAAKEAAERRKARGIQTYD